MAFSLPNPTVPTNGQSLDATPILANEVAIAQAIASFDGSQVQAGTLLAAAFNSAINPNTLLNETTFPFVASGLVWSGDSYGATLNGSMTAGTLYYNGIRVSVNSVSAHAFTASKDTYVDIDVNGNITYSAVTNNAASPALTANSIRVAIIVTGAGNIANAASVNQGQETAILPIASSVPYCVVDSIGNLICPRDSNRKRLGYRQITGNVTSTATTAGLVAGLSCPVIVPTSRSVKITIFTGDLSLSSSPKQAVISIWDGTVGSGTQLQSANEIVSTSAVGNAMTCSVLITPSTSTKTYNFGLTSDGGGGVTATLVAASTTPAYILVELE
jgi:hypothetical protein